MNLKETPTSQNYIYKGKIVNLRVDDVLLPDGSTSKREVIEHSGGVCVAAITDNDEVLLVKQFRYPYMEEIYEIPAGKREYGEDPFICGKRELKEETGAVAEEYIDLGTLYPTPGYCGEIIYMFAAKNLTFLEPELDNGEFLVVEKVPFNKCIELIMSGKIKDAKTQIALLKLNQLKKNGKF